MNYVEDMGDLSKGHWPDIVESLNEGDTELRAALAKIPSFDTDKCYVVRGTGGENSRFPRIAFGKKGLKVRTSVKTLTYMKHTGRVVPLAKTPKCGKKFCINPMHQTEIGSADWHNRFGVEEEKTDG